MVVNNFKVGDGIVVQGWTGTVVAVEKEMRGDTPCTYLQVRFDNPKDIGYQYEGGWYGGTDDVVTYGYFKR